MPNPGIGQATARESQVTGQFVRLKAAGTLLHEQLEHLEQRISPLLRGPMPDAGSSLKEKEQGALVAHAEQMGNFAQMIESANHRIEDILNRLEL